MGDCYSFLENGFVVFFYGLILVSTKGSYQRFLDSFHAVEETDVVLRDGGAVHGQIPCLVAEPFFVRTIHSFGAFSPISWAVVWKSS